MTPEENLIKSGFPYLDIISCLLVLFLMLIGLVNIYSSNCISVWINIKDTALFSEEHLTPATVDLNALQEKLEPTQPQTQTEQKTSAEKVEPKTRPREVAEQGAPKKRGTNIWACWYRWGSPRMSGRA